MTSEHGISPESKRKSRKPVIATIATIATLAAAGSIIGIEVATHEPNKKIVAVASGDPSKTPEANPTNKPKTVEASGPNVETTGPVTVDQLLISTDLTQEQVGDKFEADWDALENANETDSFDTDVVLHKTSVAEQAPKDVAIFAEAVTPSGSKSTTVTNWLSGLTTGHTDTLTDWFATYESNNAADHHPYHSWTTVDSVKAIGTPTTTSLELEIDITQHNNGADNTVGANSVNGKTAVNDVKFVNENGNWKASDIH